jgi:hypothetical protein
LGASDHAATNLARLLRDQGKRTEARNLLAPSTAGSPKASLASGGGLDNLLDEDIELAGGAEHE